MRVPYVKVRQTEAKKEIDRLKGIDELLGDCRIKREGSWVLIPVKHAKDIGDFEENVKKRMEHIGSFERISDFFVIKERDGWGDILNEIIEKQTPRAIFLDKGVEGPFRIRKLERVYGSGTPSGTHKENGLRYLVDLEKAYFSPRLAGLRRNIADTCLRYARNGLTVDMYAGVGPISIPLLKRNARVLSIDINPDAVKLMSQNMKLNKVKGDALIADSNRIYDCLSGVDQMIMNNPTQSLQLSKRIIASLDEGAVVHTTYISNRKEGIRFEGVEVLESKVVHGYSPSSSLFYFMLRKK